MENGPLRKSLPKTLCPFKVISTTSDTATVDENSIRNIVSIDKVNLAPTKPQEMAEPTEKEIFRTQIIAEMKTEPMKLTHP